MALDPRQPPRNHLLAALPGTDLVRLLPELEPVKLTLGEVLVEQGDPIAAVIFPETGWASNLITLANGDGGEVGLIGHEGMVGLPLLFGDNHGQSRIIVQAAGTALRLDATKFRQALVIIPSLQARLSRYALAFLAQVCQIAACNGRHQIERRLARWLLLAHDRADSDAFQMTHDFLAQMLGVRRAGVTIAAGRLQKAGLIRYDRGTVEIANRPGLEATACECYHLVEREFRRLLGPSAPS